MLQKKYLSLVFSVLVTGVTPLIAGPLTGETAPDTGAGGRRAQMCFMCHGEDGKSKMPGTPSLACQDEAYLEKAIRDYREGDRKDASMAAMVQPLTDQDISNIAAYFSHLSCISAE